MVAFEIETMMMYGKDLLCVCGCDVMDRLFVCFVSDYYARAFVSTIVCT